MTESDVTPPRPACRICGRAMKPGRLVPAAVIRPKLARIIARSVPGWGPESFICHDDLDTFRSRYVEELLHEELGDITALEESVIERIAGHETMTVNVDAQLDRKETLGERIADNVADFGGSWTFIFCFAGFLGVWMFVNSAVLLGGWDPYPYILLNLILSCIAALQAPVIMMSQNRSAARDRARGENEYMVNLKAELEIRLLHEKLDHLLRTQFDRLMETQQIQIELMHDMTRRKRPREEPSGRRLSD